MEFLDVFKNEVLPKAIQKEIQKKFDKYVKPQVTKVMKNEFVTLAKKQAKKAMEDKNKVIKTVLIAFAITLILCALFFFFFKLGQLCEQKTHQKKCGKKCCCKEEEEATLEEAEEEAAEEAKEEVEEEPEETKEEE